MRTERTFAVIGMGVALGPLVASAQVSRSLEFNVDGVLPSAAADIQLYNNSGRAESACYSVSGGLLHQTTRVITGLGNVTYVYPNRDGLGGLLNSNLPTAMTARIRVLAIEGEGAHIQFTDGARRCLAALTRFSPQSVGVTLLTAGGLAAAELDVFAWHTYRLESDPARNLVHLVVDDDLRITGRPPPYPAQYNGFNWGDGFSPEGSGADADWDFVRVTQCVQATLLMSASGNTANICWCTRPGAFYQLQGTPSLPATTWQNLGIPVQGTGTNACTFVSTRTSTMRFFRVEVSE